MGQLEGFTAEQQEIFQEGFSPADPDLLPNSTGGEPVALPDDGIISTPIPEEQGPQIVFMPRPGEPTPINPNSDADTQRGHRRENESAEILRAAGFDVLQNPRTEGEQRPDYLINGEIYDHYAPSTNRIRNIWDVVNGKVDRGQADNIVIGLQDTNIREEDLRRQFEDWPIEGLGDVIIIRQDGTIGRL